MQQTETVAIGGAISAPSKKVEPKLPILAFTPVPQIHSVAYYIHKGHLLGDIDHIITGQMEAAYNVIAKNIEKQKAAGVAFTSADLKKFQLGQPEMHTVSYYAHHRHGGAVYYREYIVKIRSLETYLQSYIAVLNADLEGRMEGTIALTAPQPLRPAQHQ